MDLMKYSAVIFDLDGTLLDTLDDLADSVNYAMSACGFPLRTREQTRLSIGNGVPRLIELSVPGGTGNPLYEKCLSIFKDNYFANRRNRTKPFDGIPEMLRGLKKLSVPTGVVSNKFDSAVKQLCAEYFGDLIDVAIGESPQVRRKPAPDCLEEAMRIIGVNPHECLYVGDSDTDIFTARNAGVDCASVLWGYRDEMILRSAGANKIISSPEQILKLVFGSAI